MTPGRKRTTLAIGVAVAVILGSALAVCSRGLYVQLLCYRLRREPARFDAALLAPPGSALAEALGIHLRTREGKTALLGRLIEGFLAAAGHQTATSMEMPPKYYLRGKKLNEIQLGWIGHRPKDDLYWWGLSFGDDPPDVWGLCVPTSPLMGKAWKSVDVLLGEDVRLPQFEALRFRIVPLEDSPPVRGDRIRLIGVPGSILFGATGHVCVIEHE